MCSFNNLKKIKNDIIKENHKKLNTYLKIKKMFFNVSIKYLKIKNDKKAIKY